MVTQPSKHGPGGYVAGLDWVLLLHRLPREPSAPRIALWRAVRRLGVVLLGDGLVALPATARNVEHLEWLAAGIEEQGGTASTWIARPRLQGTSASFAAQARDAVEAEYRAVMREVRQVGPRASAIDRRRALRRLRAELRRIAGRDYFGAPSAGAAREAVERLAQPAADEVRERSRRSDTRSASSRA